MAWFNYYFYVDCPCGEKVQLVYGYDGMANNKPVEGLAICKKCGSKITCNARGRNIKIDKPSMINKTLRKMIKLKKRIL
jgi:hypothetical protein